MATGKLPFKAENKHGLYDEIVKKQPIYPDEIDPHLRDLLSQLLNKNVSELNDISVRKGLIINKYANMLSLSRLIGID